MHGVDKVRDEKNVTLYRHEIGWALRAWQRGYVWLCVGGKWRSNICRVFLLRVVNMLTLFRHVIEIRQVATPHLSFCRSTAIVHYLSSLYIANRTFTQSQFATIFGEEENFARCINLLFLENRLRRTPLLTRQNWMLFKRRRHCI